METSVYALSISTVMQTMSKQLGITLEKQVFHKELFPFTSRQSTGHNELSLLYSKN